MKITDLEKALNQKIKRNFKSIGFDTASKTGIGTVVTDDKNAEIDWTYLYFKSDDIKEIYRQMYLHFKDFIHKDIDCCVIEDVYVGRNPTTSIKLARFGGFVMAHAINNEVHFETISAVSARAKLKINTRAYKGKSKVAVKKWLKETLNLDIKEDNCADGIVLALLGIIEDMNFAPKTKKKKRRVKKRVKKKVKRKS